MSARDSQGGPSPSPCPGVRGLSRFTPAPQHHPSTLYPCSALPECPQRESQGCSLFRLQRHLPQTPAQDPCRVPILCLCPSLGPAPSSCSQNILRGSGLGGRPHIPHSADTGTVWGRVCTTQWPRRHHMWCEVTVPEACPVRPAHNTQEGPQQHAGGARARDRLLISGCQQGHRGLGDCRCRHGPASLPWGPKTKT